MSTTKKLTPKQELFIIEYSKDFNATEAAKRAGYSAHTAAVQGQQNLRKLNDLIAQRKEAVLQKAGGRGIATLEQTLRLATAMAFHDPRKLFDAHGNPIEVAELERTHAAMIAGFEIEELFDGKGENRKKIGYVRKYKLADRTPFVHMLLKFHNAFPSNKGKEALPAVPPPRWDTSGWTKEDWEDFKRLREKAKQPVIEAQAHGH